MKSKYNLNQYKYNFCKNSYNSFKNSTPILLHAYTMKLMFHITYNLKLHDVISTCFVLNMMRYDGHNMKFNPLLMKFILGYVEVSLTFNTDGTWWATSQRQRINVWRSNNTKEASKYIKEDLQSYLSIMVFFCL